MDLNGTPEPLPLARRGEAGASRPRKGQGGAGSVARPQRRGRNYYRKVMITEEALNVWEIGRAGPGEQPRKAGRPAEAVERAPEGLGGVTVFARGGHRRGEPGGSGGAAPELERWRRVFLDGGQQGLKGKNGAGGELMRTRAKLGEMTMRVELQTELLEKRGYGDELRKLLKHSGA